MHLAKCFENDEWNHNHIVLLLLMSGPTPSYCDLFHPGSIIWYNSSSGLILSETMELISITNLGQLNFFWCLN